MSIQEAAEPPVVEAVNLFINTQEYQVRSCALRLAGEMKSLGRRLVEIAERLESDTDVTVNSLGEVQSQGSIVDSLCGRLWSERQALELIRQCVASTTAADAASQEALS